MCDKTETIYFNFTEDEGEFILLMLIMGSILFGFLSFLFFVLGLLKLNEVNHTG